MTIENLLPATGIALDMTRNPIVVNVLAHDPVGIFDRTGLEYFLEIWVPTHYGSNTYKLLDTLDAREEPKLVTGAIEILAGAFFEISSLLDGMLETVKPGVKQTKISVSSKMVTPYYCVAKVKNNGVLVDTKNLPSKYAIKSGVSELDYESYKGSFFSNYIGNGRKFLTYKPVTSIIQAGQTEYLNFLTNYTADISTIKLKMWCKLKKGGEIIEVVKTITGVLPMNVYCIPVEFPSNILSCSVWLVNQDDLRISEVRNFLVDQRYKRKLKRIVFENSLGVFESFNFHGDSAETVNFTKQIGEQFVGFDYLAESAESVTRSVAANREISIAIQWAKKEIADYLTDLMFSKKVYLETDRNHLPLIALGDSYLKNDDAEDWAGRRFVFAVAKQETNYSNLPTPELVAERPKGWRQLATACKLDARGRYNGFLQVTMLERYYLDNNQLVLPHEIRPNVNGEDGYIAPVQAGACAFLNTPHLSAEIVRNGTFTNQTCTNGLWGDYPEITIDENAWGSLFSDEDAQAKAELEWQSLNTQAYANEHGACDVSPYLYNIPGGVPAGRFWVRLQTPSIVQTNMSAISWSYVPDPGHRPGNGWWNQTGNQVNQLDVVGLNVWDVSFPVKTGGLYDFNLYMHGSPGRTFKYYINGVLMQSAYYTGHHQSIALTVQPADGDRVFFLIE